MEAFALVNGKRVGVDPADRGLAYGDGLFETMACCGGRIRWLEYHLDRLSHGCARLAIPLPPRGLLRQEIEAGCAQLERGVVKLIVTRGAGERGYAPPEPPVPTRILSITPWLEPPSAHYTEGVKVRTCALRLGENPQLAGLKHLCRLEQVLARMELTGSGVQEGLLRSASGRVIGGITSNLFAVKGARLLTPDVSRCGVRGVMRRIVLEHASQIGLQPAECDLYPADLAGCDELFLTNAVSGIRPISRLDGRPLGVGPTTLQLARLLGQRDA